MTIRKTSQAAPKEVRVRRVYFDCRYGQLHVRTAFPGSGGFDERTTLLCIHAPGSSGSVFNAFLPLMGVDRSIYAPDLPGCGESDPAPQASPADLALALDDFLNELRVRAVDILAVGEGSGIAAQFVKLNPQRMRKRVDLSAADASQLTAQPEVLVRRLRELFV